MASDQETTLVDQIEERRQELREESQDAEDLLEIRYYDGALDELSEVLRIIDKHEQR